MKLGTCKICKGKFEKRTPLHSLCSGKCAIEHMKRADEKAKAPALAKSKRETKAKLDAIADSIIQHVTQMKNTKQWQDGFEPAPLTYINQGRWSDEIFTGEGKTPSNTKPWYISSTGIEAKAIELGIAQLRDENFTYFKSRVYEAAGITNEMIRAANQDFGRKAA